MAENILFPAARMIGGNLDKLFPVLESDNKTPKLGRDNQPLMDCSIGIAIQKGTEKAWWETPWGAIIYQVGSAAHPNLVASPAFSWKVIDGDSTVPNKAGKRPCDKTGHPGHWVLWFSQGWLPKRCNENGTVELPEGSIVPGYYVQVWGSVAGNKLVPNGTPGVYLNPLAVALVAHGEKIASDVDTAAIGFGGVPLPAGAQPIAPVVAGMPPMGTPPALPGAATPPPAPAAAPPVPAGPVMLPAAQGQTYDAMIAAGWTDALLVQHGMMQAPAPVAAPTLPPVPPVAATPPTPPVVAPTAPSATFLAPPVPPAPADGPVMLPAAQGVTYEAFKAQGWTDEQLRAQGMMQ